jgi:hypothetical protein
MSYDELLKAVGAFETVFPDAYGYRWQEAGLPDGWVAYVLFQDRSHSFFNADGSFQHQPIAKFYFRF